MKTTTFEQVNEALVEEFTNFYQGLTGIERNTFSKMLKTMDFRSLKDNILNSDNIIAILTACVDVFKVNSPLRSSMVYRIIATEAHEGSSYKRKNTHCNETIQTYLTKYPEMISTLADALREEDRKDLLIQLTSNKIPTGYIVVKDELVLEVEAQDDIKHDALLSSHELIKKINLRYGKLNRDDQRIATRLFDENFSLEFFRKCIYSDKKALSTLLSCVEKITNVRCKYNFLRLFLLPPSHEDSKEKFLDSRFLDSPLNKKKSIILKIFDNSHDLTNMQELLRDHMKTNKIVDFNSGEEIEYVSKTPRPKKRKKDNDTASEIKAQPACKKIKMKEEHAVVTLFRERIKSSPMEIFDEDFSYEYLRKQIYATEIPGKILLKCLNLFGGTDFSKKYTFMRNFMIAHTYENTKCKNDQPLDSRFYDSIGEDDRNSILDFFSKSKNRRNHKQSIEKLMFSTNIIDSNTGKKRKQQKSKIKKLPSLNSNPVEITGTKIKIRLKSSVQPISITEPEIIPPSPLITQSVEERMDNISDELSIVDNKAPASINKEASPIQEILVTDLPMFDEPSELTTLEFEYPQSEYDLNAQEYHSLTQPSVAQMGMFSQSSKIMQKKGIFDDWNENGLDQKDEETPFHFEILDIMSLK